MKNLFEQDIKNIGLDIICIDDAILFSITLYDICCFLKHLENIQCRCQMPLNIFSGCQK